MENYCHVVACSNSELALHLVEEDRRTIVPRVTEDVRTKEYWTKFHGWLQSGGLGIIKWFLDRQVLKPGFVIEPGERAPMTSMKQDIIENSRSPGSQLAYDLGLIACESKKQVVLAISDGIKWVAEKRGLSIDDRRMERGLTIRKAFVAAGLKEPKRKADGTIQRYSVGGRLTYSPIFRSRLAVDKRTSVPTSRHHQTFGLSREGHYPLSIWGSVLYLLLICFSLSLPFSSLGAILHGNRNGGHMDNG